MSFLQSFMSTASVPYKSYSQSLTSTHAIPYGTSIPVLTTTKSYHCYHHYNSTRTPATGRTFRVVCCENKENAGGDSIGIVSYLQGKNYLITGATGFLAKAFIEKMLRTVPDVGKIFLLIKAKNKEAAIHRLKTEILELELFKCLEQMHGKSFKAFMMRKLVPVAGNVCESNLGMDPYTANEIAKEVDVIINSAADTTFDERYDVALNINTRGPSRLLGFAKKCKKLSLFLHVSTAYANGERQGLIMEEPFHMGQTIAEESATSKTPPESIPVLDIIAEIELASDLKLSVHENVVAQKMIELGLQRAKIFGWQNTYEFTKAMGEMLLNSMRGDIPLVIIRPSVIESSIKEPFPGWIEGIKMLDPLILSYGKGRLPGFIVDPKAVIDVVPLDMVVNASIAAIAKHGIAAKPELHVYHVGSSAVNPLLLHDLFKFSCNHFTCSPLMNSERKNIRINEMKFFNSMDNFASYISDEIAQRSGLMDTTITDSKLRAKLEIKRKKIVEHAVHLAKIYEPYMFDRGRFDNHNTQKLMEGMSLEEMRDFGFNIGSINWEDYILNVHIPGFRRHVLKGRLGL
ncbi:fatty acyl-CoA reductase 2, chloroplastic-like [Quercus robur]|uniref:fatty acyl-CoA reductase 2, chloroplastic-like n=1 Tax=Quercus robur TaxID=38942 RepID=UPI00216178BB|nr:fatty acyl-CoA reductase 2, chloroplastic-like [Quercus robur]